MGAHVFSLVVEKVCKYVYIHSLTTDVTCFSVFPAASHQRPTSFFIRGCLWTRAHACRCLRVYFQPFTRSNRHGKTAAPTTFLGFKTLNVFLKQTPSHSPVSVAQVRCNTFFLQSVHVRGLRNLSCQSKFKAQFLERARKGILQPAVENSILLDVCAPASKYRLAFTCLFIGKVFST